MTRSLTLVMILALAGCGSSSRAPGPAATSPSPAPSSSAPAFSAPSPPAAAPIPTPTAEATQDPAVLSSRDCRTVAQAYTEAVAHNDFAFAARVWNDPVIDAARLKAVFNPYAIPQIEISKVQEEGAAGSLYCTVTGKISDVANPNMPRVTGEIVLRRVNDVPGATPDQLRWTIQSSTFIEKLQRSSKGGAT
jgi:hypothetical protein